MTDRARGFGSDNFSGAHPEVLAAVAAANDGHVPAYGADPYTARAAELFREHFGDAAEPFLVFNGTGANVLALRVMTRAYEAVICPSTAHLNVDECGAPEQIARVKLLAIDTPDGKLTPELAATRVERLGDEHAVQPRVISISESTELGTIYTPDEIATLADFAHERALLLHVDGARLANAAAALDVPLGVLAADAGVDVLSFGGTKNGLMLGDAVVLLRPGLALGFEFLRKQTLQLASKSRFLGAQFVALLEGDLWLRNARHANAMAGRLADGLGAVEGVVLAQPCEANAVFANLPARAIERLMTELPGDHPFYVWNEPTGTVRLVCSWDTQPEDVDTFLAAVRDAVG